MQLLIIIVLGNVICSVIGFLGLSLWGRGVSSTVLVVMLASDSFESSHG